VNYKLCELYNVQSYQNTNKITFNPNSFLFACFSIALECCKYARMRFHCTTVLVVLSICALTGNIADHAMENVSLAAIARYISVTTIYTVGYLQIFNARHFFSSTHCHDL